MKRLLLLWSVVLIAMCTMATTPLDVDSIRVTYYSSDFYSEEGWYCYAIELSHKSENPNEEFPYVEFFIYQETNEGLVDGTYTLADGTMTDLVVLRNLYDAIALELGGYDFEAVQADLIVENQQDGTCILSMSILNAEGEDYSLSIQAEIHVIESRKHPYNDPYLLERQDPQEFNMTMDVLTVDDSQFYTENTIALRLQSNARDAMGLFYRSVLWVNTDTQIPAVGTYPILGTGEIGTVDASYGYDTIQQVIYPSYFALSDDVGNLYDPDIYFMVQGEVEISYPAEGKIRIRVEAESYWGSTVVYEYVGDLNYVVPETDTYHVVLTANTSLKNTGYFGTHEYSLQVNGSDDAGTRYRITMDLLPDQDRITGVFSRAANTLDVSKSAIETNVGAQWHVADGEVQIAETTDALYSVHGWLRDERGNMYYIDGDEVEIEFESDESYYYEMETPDTRTRTILFNNIVWNQGHVEDEQYLEIVLVNSEPNADGTKDEAVLWMVTPTAAFEAGVFPINSSMEYFTFYASPGYRDGGVYPCIYYKVLNSDISEVWFLVDGTVTIDYPTATSVSVEVHAVSYFGSRINLLYNVAGQGIDNLQRGEPNANVNRRIVDGQLLLECGGRTYNAHGQRIK